MSETQTPTNVITVPLNEDGTIGTLPEPLQKFIDGKIAQVSKRKAEQTAAPDPVERERMRQLEEENQKFKIHEAEREKRYEEALKLRETEYTAKLQAAEADKAKRTERLLTSMGAEIRAAAIKLGAREDALSTIEAVLRPQLALSDDLMPVVLKDGKPSDLTIEALVQETLDRETYFRAKPAGVAGGSRPGASITGVTGAVAQAESALKAAQDALKANPNDPRATDAVFQATRKLTEAKRKAS